MKLKWPFMLRKHRMLLGEIKSGRIDVVNYLDKLAAEAGEKSKP